MSEKAVVDPDQFLKKAKALVCDAQNNHSAGYFVLAETEVYIVWFSKTLGNWKALLSTDVVPNQYWEVTYNGAKEEAYVDHYEKKSNVCFADVVVK